MIIHFLADFTTFNSLKTKHKCSLCIRNIVSVKTEIKAETCNSNCNCNPQNNCFFTLDFLKLVSYHLWLIGTGIIPLWQKS